MPFPSLLNIQVIGIHANPVDESLDDSINQIDNGVKSVGQDSNPTPTLNDATAQNVRV